MVRKTKKEKRAADLRKKSYFSQQEAPSDQPASPSSGNVSWIKKDLAKSFILALLVLIFQLVLYWRLE